MYRRQNYLIIVFALYLFAFFLCYNPLTFAQDAADDEKIIERYKLMLSRKPKEGSTFDRLYQFYLEGNGLDAMVADYQAEVETKPDDPNVQLILGHIYKRLGKDTDAVTAYQRAVELTPDNYYPHFALGQVYAILLQHENAISALKQAAALTEETQDATPEDMTAIYKALGRAYFRRDKVDEAVAAWTKIAELDPQNIFARTELADLFIEQELYEQAIAQHEAIIKHKTDDPYRVCLSRREIGNIYETKGDYQKAIQSYDLALALTAPGNWLRKDLQHRIIGIFAANSDWQKLIVYYQQKLKNSPNEPEILGLLADAYIENQQLEAGIKTYREGLKLAPTDTNLRRKLIAALRNAEKYVEVAAEYELLSQQLPDNYGIFRELGEIYLLLTEQDKARATYQRMIEKDPKNASTHLILAEIYTKNEWIKDAISAYENAISLAPENLDYIEYFGEFYYRNGNREKAIETWNLMVTDTKAVAENFNRLAKLLDSKKFHSEAIVASRKAVELMPNDYQSRQMLAKRLMKNKDFDAALTEFTEAIKLAPNAFFAEEMDNQRIELYRRQGTLINKIEMVEQELKKSGHTENEIFAQKKQLAKMFLKLGNITYAIEILLNAKTLKPNDITINRWLADVYTQQNRIDDANDIYKFLIEIDAVNAREYYTNIARSHLKGMNFNEATVAAKQVIAHSPRNPEGHQLLAEIVIMTENFDAAIDSFKQALRLQPDAIDIRSNLAKTYKLSGKSRQALGQYWRCWELSNTINDKLLFVKPLSDTYSDLGQRSEFEEKLKLLSKSNTFGVAPVVALAEFYRIEGDLPSARFQLARALDKERENPELLTQLVNISIELGDNQDALTYQQQLVKVHPDPNQQRRLGALLFDAGREQEAIQAWTKLLHAKNQALDAEVKLAKLLIKNGFHDEALFVIERAQDKISGNDSYLPLHQLGALLVSINALDRARTYFQRILDMPYSQKNTTNKVTTSSSFYISSPPLINTEKFELAADLLYDIQDQSYRGRNVDSWMPNSLEEAKAGALVHLVTIDQQKGKLNELIQQYESDAAEKPNDIQTLETLAQLYTLIRNSKKANETIEQLIAASPNDATYQAIRLSKAIEENVDSDIILSHLKNSSGLSEDARVWYTTKYVNQLFHEGKLSEAEKLIKDLQNTTFTDLKTLYAIIGTLVLADNIEAAEKLILSLPNPSQNQLQDYRWLYQRVAYAYINKDQIEKAVDLSWIFFEKTKPIITNTKSVANITSSTSISNTSFFLPKFPSATIYYNKIRLVYLEYFSGRLWFKNQEQALIKKLKYEFDSAEGDNRIFPGLALSYCYWWNNQRNNAQEILIELQKEFPRDLTLKLNTVMVSLQNGQYTGSLKLLEELSESDPINRPLYDNLTLQVALQTGNTIVIRGLITRLLNSPNSVQQLYEVSKKLQSSGYTQFAIAVMNKAMKLANGIQDSNFLMQLSRHMENLGRGQDAVIIAERAIRFSNRRDQYGRTISDWNLERAKHLTKLSKSQQLKKRLVEATQKNPNSFQLHLKLALFYKSNDQLENATEAYKNALTIRPKDAYTRQQYAELLKNRGKSQEAVIQYTQLLKDNPYILGYQTSEVIETFFHADKEDEIIVLAKDMVMPSIGRDFSNDFAEDVAHTCMRKNNPTAAIEIYEELTKAQPKHSYYHRSLANAYNAIGNREKAIQILRQQLAFEDTYPPESTIRMLMQFYIDSGEIDEFIKEYEAKLTDKPTDNYLRYLVASMKITTNDIQGALKLTLQLLDDASVGSYRIKNLADAFLLAGESDIEFQILQKMVQNQKTNPSTYGRLGQIYSLKGKKEKAQDAIRKMGNIILRRDTNNYYDKNTIAATYMQHQLWDDAEIIYNEFSNDHSLYTYRRREAEEQIMKIMRLRDGFTKSTHLNEKIKDIDIGKLRPIAKDFTRRGDIQEAVEIYQYITEVMPEDFESRAQLASLYSRQNQFDKAVETWESLLKEDPGNTKYQDGLVRTYKTSGKFDDALKIAQQYINSDEDNSTHYVRLANLYADDERIDEAISAYNKSIELSSGNGKLYRELAHLHLRNNDTDAAENAFKQAIRYTSQDSRRQDIEQEMVKLYKSVGKLKELEQKVETGETLTFEIQKDRAKGFLDSKDYEKASIGYTKALDMTTDEYEQERIYEDLLEIYVKLGKNDSALQIHDNLAIVDSVENARNTLINIYRNEEKLDELITIYKIRIDNDPKNIEYHTILSDIYRRTNDYEKSAETYQTLCRLQPDNVINYYYAAAALNRSSKPESAKILLNQGKEALVFSNQKGNTSFLEKLANICYNGKLYDSAIKFADAALAESAGYRTYGSSLPTKSIYKLLGKCYLATKQYQEAVYAYQQVLNLAEYPWDRDDAEKAINKAYKDGNLYAKQIPQLLKKVQDKPKDTNAHLELAQSYENSNMINEAISQYKKLSELQPDNVQWQKKLGSLYQNLPIERRETGEVIEGTALTLPGGSWVEIDDSETLDNITEQVTVSAWIKPTDFPNSYAPIIFKGDERVPGIKNRSYILYLKNNGSIQMAASPGGGGEASFYSSNGAIKLNTWYHVACVIDAKKNAMKLFIDGIEVGNRNFRDQKSFYKSRLPLRIGWTHEIERPTQSPFVGLIDEVRIWNIARTENEIWSDINTQLKGDEPGLVAYWKFDGETNGMVLDASSNKNHGRLIGNGKFAPYTRPIFESARGAQLTKAAAAYEKAVELDPTSYELYRSLAETYTKGGHSSDAEAVYRRALGAPLTQSQHDDAIQAIWAFYANKKNQDRGIAILEELRQKMENSAVPHKLLGDVYKKAGDSEKAENAYAQWVEIRQRQVNQQDSAGVYQDFAEELLKKEIFPETALKFAKRAAQSNTSSSYQLTLGQAYLVNEQNEAALKQFKQGLNGLTSGTSERKFFTWISRFGKKTKDKETYIRMLNELVDATSGNLNLHLNLNLLSAEYCLKNDMPEKAKTYIQNTGFIAEGAWLRLGPFDITDGTGLDTAYISENITQVNMTAKYDAGNGHVSWHNLNDDVLNGFINLGEGLNWGVAYAFTTVTSPDEREVQFRFDSDDQGKVWLNGEEVFVNTGTYAAQIDRDTIPVTLKKGKNSILVKVCEQTGGWGFYLRITDQNGKPFDDLKIHSTMQN